MTTTDRGTGRTTRMLEEAIACDAEVVFVVAHSRPFALELMRRTADILRSAGEEPIAQKPSGAIRRRDGRAIVFTDAHDHAARAMGYRGPAFIDHAVYDLVPYAVVDRIVRRQ